MTEISLFRKPYTFQMWELELTLICRQGKRMVCGGILEWANNSILSQRSPCDSQSPALPALHIHTVTLLPATN